MNFLSHFYFDRHNTNAYEVLGVILPDLVKNANKTWNIHPEKLTTEIYVKEHQSILKGWQRHLEVDKIFHNTTFFLHHQHQIKLILIAALEESPVKPFFLGHISLELMLDSLLINENEVNVNSFYTKLNEVDEEVIAQFLEISKLEDINRFFHFFKIFKEEQYLRSYTEADKITYALKRICMRIWKDPFTTRQEYFITKQLSTYKNHLKEEYITIFDLIEAQLNP